MPLLDGLDAIDWSAYEMTYLPAAELPRLLRALVDGSHDARETIHENLIHQMTISSASAPAIPFLVEILVHCRDDAETACFILELLGELGTDLDLFAGPVVDDGEEAQSYRACQSAIAHELVSIVPFVYSRNGEVASLAISLVGAFPEAVEISGPALERLLSEPERALEAALALARLLGPDSQAMAQDMLENDDEIVATCGACAAVIASDTIFDDRIVARLVQSQHEQDDFGLPVDECFDQLLDRDAHAVMRSLQRMLSTADQQSRIALETALREVQLSTGAR